MIVLLIIATLTSTAAMRTCEPITIPLCTGIGYNHTSYPNSYGHEKQEEAGLEVHQFYPLVEYGCYKHLKFFLCTLYTPICQANYDKPILPCKELCLQARSHCSPIMQQYGFRWPETLSCDALPSKEKQMLTGEICAAPPDTPSTKTPMKPQSVATTRRPVIIDDSIAEMGCECRCASPFVTSFDMSLSVGGVPGCRYPCKSSSLSVQEQGFLESWMSIWAIACLVASTFTILTFLIEPSRFQYPERPIFVLAFCQLMVSVGVIIRISMGPEVACDQEQAAMNGEESTGSACFAIFLLTYYFGMAASVWWVLLSLTWVLAAGSKWSSEAIASYAIYFHAIGWIVPALQTAVVIWFNAIDGDAVTGLCYVGNTNVYHLRGFVLAPLSVYFATGVIFLLYGFFNLCHIRAEVQRQHSIVDGAGRLTRLMSKIGVFSLLYTVPALLAILVHLYEQEHRPLWEKAAVCPCSPHGEKSEHAVTMRLALLKTCCLVVLGCSTGAWVLSPKTFASWRARLCCSSRADSATKYQQAELIYAKSDCSNSMPHYFNNSLRQQKYGFGSNL